jgi:hypothetical protein
MKIACFTLTYWNDAKTAAAIADELRAWVAEVRGGFRPDYLYMCSGTYSDPKFNPLPDVPLINAEVVYRGPKDFTHNCYALCAEEAGLWYALLNTDADVVVQMCTDSIVNEDMRPLLDNFMARPELVCAPAWCRSYLDDAFVFYKRNAVVKYLNGRLRANLMDVESGEQLITEDEKTRIFKGEWWNPWPANDNMRQDWNVGSCAVDSAHICRFNWPVVIRPAPDVTKFFKLRKLW